MLFAKVNYKKTSTELRPYLDTLLKKVKEKEKAATLLAFKAENRLELTADETCAAHLQAITQLLREISPKKK